MATSSRRRETRKAFRHQAELRPALQTGNSEALHHRTDWSARSGLRAHEFTLGRDVVTIGPAAGCCRTRTSLQEVR